MKPAGKKMHLLQRGSALALVLSVITILLAVGTGLLSLGLHSQLFSIRTGNEIVARSAADAGLTEALFRMNEQLKTKPWSDSSLPGVTDGALPGCKAILATMSPGIQPTATALNASVMRAGPKKRPKPTFACRDRSTRRFS